MASKSFRLNCVVRVLFLTLSMWLAVFLITKTSFIASSALLILLVALQVFMLIRYIESTNRLLSNLFDSIRFSDFTRSFHIKELGSTFSTIESSFNDVINDFQLIKEDNERSNHYLQNIIHHISIALIVFQDDGTINLINIAAKKLFRVTALKNISELSDFDPELVRLLFSIPSGEKTRFRCEDSNTPLELTIQATSFRQKDRSLKLVSIQDIQSELEEQELRSWQNLIKVLTHEIMNSITPISSLSSLVNQMIDDIQANLPEKTLDDTMKESLSDIGDALKTIHKRSDGLIEFVDTYRNLTRIPTPVFAIFPIRDLFYRMMILTRERMDEQEIDFVVSVNPESLELSADEKMIEQILINLIENAMHAIASTDTKKIELSAKLGSRDRPVIQVTDTGSGILDDVIDKIFIPFYTTKPKGSGIGLSLSRQIMRQHGGTISVQSTVNQGTIFTLTF